MNKSFYIASFVLLLLPLGVESLFTGDTTIWKYIGTFCKENAKKTLIVVDSFVINDRHSEVHHNATENRLQRKLKQYNCSSFIIYLHKPNQDMLALFFHFQWSYKKLIILFDFTQIRLNESTFNLTLKALDRFFWSCDQCEPFICLFDLQHSLLAAWSRGVIPKLKRHFRAIFVSQSNSVIHFNPVFYGCKAVSGIFESRNWQQFAALKVPFAHCDLKNVTLNVSYNNILPFCNVRVHPNGSAVAHFAIETEILRVLQLKFNFSVRLIDGKGWGMFVHGQWTGVVGQVSRGIADIGMCFISRSNERMNAVAFSYPVYIDDITFMSRSPKLRSRGWLVFRPFTWRIWLCLLFSTLAIAAVLRVTFKLKNYHSQPSFAVINIQLLAILIGQSNTLKWSDVPVVRILYCGWLCAALVLANSFGGLFYSILALPEFESPIDTLKDISQIAKSDDGRLVTFSDSLLLETFLTSSQRDGIFYLIGQHMNRTHAKMVQLHQDVVQVIENEPKTVFIGTRVFLATYRRVSATSPLHIGQDVLDIDYLSYIFAKKSPLRAPFSRVIKQMHMTGLIEKLLRRTFERLPWKPGGRLYHNPIKSVYAFTESLALKDLRSVFILWSFGFVVGLAAFLNETILYCYMLVKQQNAKRQRRAAAKKCVK